MSDMAAHHKGITVAAGAIQGRLGSWKEIAVHLNCGVRTAQRWERLEGLPVHRHLHNKLGTVYAFRHEIDAWRRARKVPLEESRLPAEPAAPAESIAPAEPDHPVNGTEAPNLQLEDLPRDLHAGNGNAGQELSSDSGLSESRSGLSAKRVGLLAGALVLLAALLVPRLLHPVPKPAAGGAMLNLAVSPSQGPAASGSVNPEAYQDYLKGRYFWNLRSESSLRTAIDYFSRATGKDPNYALAYAGLADSYTLLALYGDAPREVMPQAKAAALKSLELDPSLAEGHTSLAAVAALYDWNWPQAEREFKRAISLNSNYSPAHHWYADLYLIPQGRYDEAIAEMQRAKALDPVSLIINTDLGWAYFVAGRDDRALEQYQEVIEMAPQFVPARFRLMQYYVEKRMYRAAVSQAEAGRRFDGRPDSAVAIARAYSAHGYRGLCQLQLREFESEPQRPRYYAASLAAAYGAIGEREKAFTVLQKAFQDRASDLVYLNADPAFDSLRGDSRFQNMERNIGLRH